MFEAGRVFVQQRQWHDLPPSMEGCFLAIVARKEEYLPEVSP